MDAPMGGQEQISGVEASAEVPQAEQGEAKAEAVVSRQLQFSIRGEESRAIIFPFREQMASWKKKTDWFSDVVARTKGMPWFTLVEKAAFGLEDVEVASVTMLRGDEEIEFAKKAAIIAENVTRASFILEVDSAQAAAAALQELAASMQCAALSEMYEPIKIGYDYDPTKYGFNEFKRKALIGFDVESLGEVGFALTCLQNSEYGKLKYFGVKGEGDITFTFDGVSCKLKEANLARKSIYVMNMTTDDFEGKTVSMGGRILRQYLGISHIFNAASIKECMHLAVRVSVGWPARDSDKILATLNSVFAMTNNGEFLEPTIGAMQRAIGVVERRSELLPLMENMGLGSPAREGSSPSKVEMGKLKEALAAVTAECKEAKSEMAKLANSMPRRMRGCLRPQRCGGDAGVPSGCMRRSMWRARR